MTKIQHLNCATFHPGPFPPAVCHCLLLEDRSGLALVDTGLGLLDIGHPQERLGQGLIDAVGFQLREEETAARQLERLGRRISDVRHVVLTHGDPDHTGGLADVPQAEVHLSAEELSAVETGDPRYVPAHFTHAPRWRPLAGGETTWFGLPARPVPLGFESEVLLVWLPGHTRGHCGVAISRWPDRWILHAGDAYYLRVELDRDDHPVSQLAAARAVDDGLRRRSLEQVRRLAREQAARITLFGYHDPEELASRSA